MKNHRHVGGRSFVLGALLAVGILLAETSSAGTGFIVRQDLQGNWQLALNGVTGCGPAAMQVNVTLNGLGVGTNATLVTHGQCGDSTVTGQTFQITSLAANGSGTANLSCGVACGWNFNIQVSSDRGTFSLVDVAPVNPGNFLSGVAIHQ